jgi:hypothetical protein
MMVFFNLKCCDNIWSELFLSLKKSINKMSTVAYTDAPGIQPPIQMASQEILHSFLIYLTILVTQLQSNLSMECKFPATVLLNLCNTLIAGGGDTRTSLDIHIAWSMD